MGNDVITAGSLIKSSQSTQGADNVSPTVTAGDLLKKKEPSLPTGEVSRPGYSAVSGDFSPEAVAPKPLTKQESSHNNEN